MRLLPTTKSLSCHKLFHPHKRITMVIGLHPQRETKNRSGNWNLKRNQNAQHVFLSMQSSKTLPWLQQNERYKAKFQDINFGPSLIKLAKDTTNVNVPIDHQQSKITSQTIQKYQTTSNINSITLLLLAPSYFRVESLLRCRYILSDTIQHHHTNLLDIKNPTITFNLQPQ